MGSIGVSVFHSHANHPDFAFALRWVVAGEVTPNHVRPAALSIAVGINWLFAFTISKLTPIMLNSIGFGTFLIFGFCCLFMALWTYVCLPETTGVALEDIKYLFERDVIIRSLQDAPGGKIFLRGRQAPSIESLRKQRERLGAEGGRATIESSSVEASSKRSSLKQNPSV